jgi:hypothetical protein
LKQKMGVILKGKAMGVGAKGSRRVWSRKFMPFTFPGRPFNWIFIVYLAYVIYGYFGGGAVSGPEISLAEAQSDENPRHAKVVSQSFWFFTSLARRVAGGFFAGRQRVLVGLAPSCFCTSPVCQRFSRFLSAQSMPNSSAPHTVIRSIGHSVWPFESACSAHTPL